MLMDYENNETPREALLQEIRNNMAACIQCGTCSASCPNAASMDLTPRQMWRKILLGLEEEVFESRTFWLCSACYSCTLRCPRGLPLTETVYALKRLATRYGGEKNKKHAAFYQAFVNNVRVYGRVQESALMRDYMLAMKNPLLALDFAPIGLKMLRKGKLHLASTEHRGSLDKLFQKVRRMEEGS